MGNVRLSITMSLDGFVAGPGFWGANPPYRHPVFVLTRHPRGPLEMEGGTRFYFGAGSA